MSNKDSRTLVNDLASDEKTLSNDEMKDVDGGKVYNETRDNPTKTSEVLKTSATPAAGTNVPTTPPTVPPVVSVDKKTQTPL